MSRTVPDFVAEIERLRSRVAEMETERGRGSEETIQISVGTFSRSRWWTRLVVARLGRFARRTCGARQRSHHGDINQSREHVGCEFEPIQSVGMTSDALLNATHYNLVTLQGARRMRVGEAKNPGPEGITVDSISPAQWDIEAQFSMPDRGSGLTGSASESSLLDAMEFDFTTADSDHDEDAITGAAVGEMSQRLVPQRAFRRRLRLTWEWEFSEIDAGCGRRSAQAAENFMRQLAARVGAIPHDAQLPLCIHPQWWSPLNVPLLWSAAGDEATNPVLDWLTEVTASMQGMVDFCERAVNSGEAVRSGWSSLRSVMRTWGVDSSEDLSQWLRSHGFAATQPGDRIPARVQGALSQEVCRTDARVVLLEAVFVQLVLHTRLCHEASSQARIRAHQQPDHGGVKQMHRWMSI